MTARSSRIENRDLIAFGIPVEITEQSRREKRHVPRVLVISVVLIVIKVVEFGVLFLTNALQASIYSSFLTLLLQMTVPACGYFGAIATHGNLVMCFCGCNMLNTILLVLDILLAGLYHGRGQMCGDEQSRRKQLCLMWNLDNNLAYFGWIINGLTMIAELLGFLWGCNLYYLIHRQQEIVSNAYRGYTNSNVIPVQPRVVSLRNSRSGSEMRTFVNRVQITSTSPEDINDEESRPFKDGDPEETENENNNNPSVVRANLIGQPSP